MKITIYTMPDCPFCDIAKSWMKQHNIDFVEREMSDPEERQLFHYTNETNTLPQIFIKRRGDHKEILAGTYSNFMRMWATDVLESQMPSNLTKFSKSYKPFYYPWAVELTRKHENAHWVEDEVDLAEDVVDWKGNKLTLNEKEFITHILRLFTQSDVAVGQNYYEQFIPKFRNNEVRNMLGSFACREGIHQRAYALLNDTLGLPDSEYHAFKNYQEMSDKIEFMVEAHTGTDRGLALALAKSLLNEGVSLFASFVMLLNFQRFGKMKGMGKVVEWSVRDETMHVEGISKLFKTYIKETPGIVDDSFKREIIQMAERTVELEDRFIRTAFRMSKIEGLTEDEVKTYIRHITDRRLLQLGMEPHFGVKDNPLPWLDWVLNGADHTNFFENKVADYDVTGLKGEWADSY